MYIFHKNQRIVFQASLIALIFGLVSFTSLNSLQADAQPMTASSTDGIWHDIDETAIDLKGKRYIYPMRYRTLRLDPKALETLLAQAPIEFSTAARTANTVISIPLPAGGFGRFRIVQAPIMAPELAAKFPELQTYLGRGLDDPTATVRLDWTPAGFHAMILSSIGTVYLDPYSQGDILHYISYFKGDYVSPKGTLYDEFGPLGDPSIIVSLVEQLPPGGASSGGELRTYRVAVAATGEYTQFHGGIVPLGMAAIVTTMNRVVGIYEREVAVRMELVANNNLIVYTNSVTDPYSNGNGSAMLEENQTNLDAVIGDANYDIGHVFSTGGGGVAYLGVPCVSGWKAGGVTGSPQPIGDPFDVDYVAHEMGHQFGANHTFNGLAGSCFGNRNPSTAYEPGSASTIMGYAGICDSHDLQPHSDDYFHGASFDEIVAFTTLGDGNNCAVITSTGNSPPVVVAGTGGFAIPVDTPFTLIGSATDLDGDPLTYGWEEFDLGPAGSPDLPRRNAPIFRSFTPVLEPVRIFPQISDIVNNTHTIGELLPTYSRSLTFRLTVRDNHISPSAGGVGNDTISFEVTNQAGPFLVTAPNTVINWTVGTQETVTWDVANTDASPVNCTGVDILLSTDGGYTYPHTLISNSPNDGSALVTVPNQPTDMARVKVACADNIFFDISDVDFILTGSQVYIPLILK